MAILTRLRPNAEQLNCIGEHMAAIQVFYSADEDPLELADKTRAALPESERWITNIVCTPESFRPKQKKGKQNEPCRDYTGSR